MSSLCSGLYLRFVWHLARFGDAKASDTGETTRVAHMIGAVLRNGKYSFNLSKKSLEENRRHVTCDMTNKTWKIAHCYL